MKTLLKSLAIVLLGLGLTAGLASASTGSMDTTGPDSSNEITFEDDVNVETDINNDTEVDAEIDQDAESGEAEVKNNTNAGDAESGDAENMFEGEVAVENDNSDANCGCVDMGGSDNEATIDTTGPNSTNEIKFNNNYDYNYNVENDTDVDVDVDQEAESGDASVYGNTNGGSATTGSASNSSSLKITVSNKN